MNKLYKLRKSNVELWEQLSKENDIFHYRMDSYESLPVEERIEKYREEVRKAEAEILKITGDPIDDSLWNTLNTEDSKAIVDDLLGNRYYVLSKMFALHCSDAEVKRIESLNAQLLQLSRNLFDRTAKMYRAVLDMPSDKNDDCISVEGTLKYLGDTAQDVLQLEDDAFYGSDFKRMILILSFMETEYHGDLALLECHPEWDSEKKHKSSMTDEELGIEHWMDDGTTWAESWLRHPKLDHIVMCYATHALVTHANYCVPDFMRLNSFEVKVNVEVDQDAEQDGSRRWWWRDCDERQFADKFLHEAENRPTGMSKGEFIYNRVVEYFDFEESDECDREWLKRNLEFEAKYPDSKVKHDNSIYKADRMASLPDCRKDDSLIDEFLKKAYSIRQQ